jgi:hypothetical protein
MSCRRLKPAIETSNGTKNMKLSDAQLRAYRDAKQTNKFTFYGKITSAIVAVLAAIGMVLSGEASAWYNLCQFLFIFFIGTFTTYSTVGRIFIRHFDAMLDMAELTVNSDASNITRLTKLRDKTK